MIDLTPGAKIKAPKDVVGGSTFIKDTDVYDAEVDMCYYGEAKSGAAFLDFKFKLIDNGFYSERIYISSAKQSLTYTKDGEEFHLPGYVTAYNLAYAAADESLHPGQDQEEVFRDLMGTIEDKEIMVYDFMARGNVARTEKVVMAMLGAKVKLGIRHRIEPKSIKTTDGYVDSANETKDSNVISSVFLSNGFTPNEVIAKNATADHLADWKEKVVGKVSTIKPKKKKGFDPVESLGGKEVDTAPANGTANVEEESFFGEDE